MSFTLPKFFFPPLAAVFLHYHSELLSTIPKRACNLNIAPEMVCILVHKMYECFKIKNPKLKMPGEVSGALFFTPYYYDWRTAGEFQVSVILEKRMMIC